MIYIKLSQHLLKISLLVKLDSAVPIIARDSDAKDPSKLPQILDTESFSKYALEPLDFS